MTKIYCAFDTPDLARAAELAEMLAPVPDIGIKLGLEFFMAQGRNGIEQIQKLAPQKPIFLDLKFHDIPNTVSSAIRALKGLNLTYINVHASGGAAMLLAANEAAKDIGAELLAVTILTSIEAPALNELGMGDNVEAQVLRLAKLVQQAGLGGVVCSAHEIKILRENMGSDFVLMVPGIRPAGSDNADQKRVMTPKEALQNGATHLVIGRPIMGAKNPAAAARDILADLASV